MLSQIESVQHRRLLIAPVDVIDARWRDFQMYPTDTS